jgi:sigma-B regulation protein RsbU (phosphoserine phosphatase)
LAYANAGHPHPLWWRSATGHFEAIEGRGMVLGESAGVVFEERQIDLAQDDILVLYTDGITEAIDASEAMFEEKRLRSAVAAASTGASQHVVESILAALQSFSGDAPQADDFTLVVVKRLKIESG